MQDAYEYLESQRLTLGFEVLAEISDILQVLEENPFLYQKIEEEKRRAMTRRFNYNIIYIVDGLNVIILAIQHGSQDPKIWKKRS